MRQRLVCSDRAGRRRWVVLLGVMVGSWPALCGRVGGRRVDDERLLRRQLQSCGRSRSVRRRRTHRRFEHRCRRADIAQSHERCWELAVGPAALMDNTTGSGNVATGEAALDENTPGGNNIAAGDAALVENTTGSSNIASGEIR